MSVHNTKQLHSDTLSRLEIPNGNNPMHKPYRYAHTYSPVHIGNHLVNRWGLDQHILAFQRLDLLRCLQVLAVYRNTRHNMVRQNAYQLALIFGLQQTREGCLGQLGERRIGRREHGEGALALQSGDQVARFECSHERRQAFSALSEFGNGMPVGASPTQSNRDRVAIPLCFRALSAEMAAPPAAVECDALARCGTFTRLFAGFFVRHSLRRRGQKLFARARVACSARGPTRPRELPFCAYG